MAQVMQALEGYVPPMECLPNPTSVSFLLGVL